MSGAPPRVSRVPVEVRSYEIDEYHHVNNAVFVQWLEHGRLSWLRDRGMTWVSIPEQHGVHVVVVSLRLDYRAEAALGDRLVVESEVTRLGRSSFVFAQRVVFENDGGGEPPRTGAGGVTPAARRVAAEGEVTMVCTKDGRAYPMPDSLRARLSGESGTAP